MKISIWIASGRGRFISSIGPSIHEINSFEDVKKLDPFLKSLGISIIYLDAYRDGILVPAYKLNAIKGWFQQCGYEVRGGIALGTYDPNFSEANVTREGIKGEEVCWTSPITQEGFKFLSTEVARCFDFVLYDDCLFSSCLCDRCIDTFNKNYHYDLKREEIIWMLDHINILPPELSSLLNEWGKFQKDLYKKVATEYICNPSREVNPNVRLVVKVPQWNEYFPMVGYNIEMLQEIFDEVWVGTEIREDLQNVGYFAYANAEFVRKKCKYDFIGTWFDTYRGYVGGEGWDPAMDPETYLEQARMSTLAKAKEIVLVSLGDLRHHTREPLIKAFREELPLYEKITSSIEGKSPLGIKFLKCADSVASSWRGLKDNWGLSYMPKGDLYINSVLGSLGIPLVTVVDYKELSKDDTVIVTQHEIIKEKVEQQWDLIGFVKNGGRVILTSEALTALYNGYLGEKWYELLGLDTTLSKNIRFIEDSKEFVINETKLVRCKIPVTVGPLLKITDESLKSFVDLIYDNEHIPVIFSKKYGLGEVIFFPITYPVKQFRFGYPVEIKEFLREFLGDFYGLWISSNKDSISIIIYLPDIVAVENFNNEAIHVKINITHKNFLEYKKATDIKANSQIPIVFEADRIIIPLDIDKRSFSIIKFQR